MAAPPQRAALPRRSAAPAAEPLAIHYAGVFLAASSVDRLLAHVPPLHEAVHADHLTLAYRPSPDACAGLPLGRAAALYVAGAVGDYRAQAVVVQPPTWLSLPPGATPHVTVSVDAEVPPKEAGELCARALQEPGAVEALSGLKLLHGAPAGRAAGGRLLKAPPWGSLWL